jgi:nucleoside-diphosphate-sugar epimerase
MIEQLNGSPKRPDRVVVIGANGFVGSSIVKQLTEKNIETLSIGRLELDLLSEGSAGKLSNILKANDVVVIAAAKAPAKDFSMLLDNLRMLRPIISSAHQVSLSHIIYISSDAVYSDSMSPLIEESETNPTSLHGIMHKTRELIIKTQIVDELKVPLFIARPTLIYGLNDPHNGYGPNRFLRQALNNEKISIFGKGEELRDHVSIDDVARLVFKAVCHKSCGILNIASGKTITFRAIAEKIVSLTNPLIEIEEIPRAGGIPHNGFRPFDIKSTTDYFPNFEYMDISEGLRKLVHDKQYSS